MLEDPPILKGVRDSRCRVCSWGRLRKIRISVFKAEESRWEGLALDLQ